MVTTTRVKKWGNALAVRLPRQVVERYNLIDGSSVKVSPESFGIVIRLERRVVVPSLRELTRRITSTNRPALVDWGRRRGREVW
ncbi:MAG: AbrB/MazE/SpoVT family DNA-binding domain-containing protein [Candidatus Vogelbacteria bacterium]|nr:AbrB/MazE/SpoVT family DNA-binding domain-containing protein [Candidatus Vogelbacteria bacterium]